MRDTAGNEEKETPHVGNQIPCHEQLTPYKKAVFSCNTTKTS